MEEFPGEEVVGSKTLAGLAERLRCHKSSTGVDECNGVVADMSRRKKTAAVLVCLFQGIEGELRVILTKRSMKLSSYPGDVALPGGRMDESDTDETATALREAMEEIGLDPSLVQVVAILEPFTCQRLNDVVPVVGLIEKMEEFNPLLNADEVDAIFDAPLDMFLKDENHMYEERDWMGWKYAVHRFTYRATGGTTFHILGLTARILIRVASIVYARSPLFDTRTLDFQRLQQLLSYAE
ncbi:hypothetical protein MLD38_029781 [Melastoma candidum]|uniref:Uncharacterized protein n=1 Tax=Melastoma candidum TaxID=119954 RepID=A0ACB9N8W0_9MYRT|nr:hypothetical protein MLD38_029781 [Melastoma candidum]